MRRREYQAAAAEFHKAAVKEERRALELDPVTVCLGKHNILYCAVLYRSGREIPGNEH